MSTTTPAVRVLLAAPALVLAVGLTGCAGDDDTKENERVESAPTEVIESSTVPSGDNGELVEPEGAIEDLMKFECTEKDGTWSAAGTITNSSDADAQYLIQVSVHSKKKGTVFGSAEDTVSIKAGEKAKVELADVYSGKETKVACTPRVVRGS